jgi:hypothetical protein
VRSNGRESSAGSADGSGRGLERTGGLLVALVLTMLAFTAPALAVSPPTINPPVPSYTSIQVSGFIQPTTGFENSYARFEISEDGVHFFGPSAPDAVLPGGASGPTEISKELRLIPNSDITLKPGTKYFLRLATEFNSFPPASSEIVETETLAVATPSVLSANDATDVSYVAAKASGEVQGVSGPDPAFDSDCRFEYVTDGQFSANGYAGAARANCIEAVSGTDPTPVTADLPDLKPGTTYHLRLAISNAGGGDSKEVSTFTTLPVDPPAVLSINDATNVEYSQAELSGEVERPANPDPAFDAQCRFEYVSALDSEPRGDTQRLTVSATGGTFTLNFGGETTTPIAFNASAAAVQSALEALPSIGSGNVSVSGGPGDQAGDNPYTIVFIGTFGSQDVGQLGTDSTGLTVAGESSAQVQTIANGHGAEGFNHAGTVPCNPETITNPAGTEPVKATVSAKPTGLAPGTTYRYRLTVSNTGGSDTKEAVNTFTTLVPGAPAVSILPPTDVTTTSAHLSGKINPGGTDPGFNVDWHFRCTPKCPGIEGQQTIAADETEHEVSVDATGLRANTTYSVVLVATNAAGRVIAGPEQFTTVAAKPAVTTFPAFALGNGTTALLGGKIDAENSTTAYWVEYGSDESYGDSVPLNQDATAGSGDEPGFFTQTVSGLQPATVYHFRLVASNSAGTEYGVDKTFTTGGGLGSSIGKAPLPDNRAWEMVSPLEKSGADVWKVKAQASTSGNALTFLSQGSFAGQPTAKGGLLSDYLSQRGVTGWSTAGITPAGGLFAIGEYGYNDFGDELDFGLLTRREPGEKSLDPELEVTPGDIYPVTRKYIRDNSTGKYRAVPAGFVGGSSDYSHLVIQTGDTLTPDGCFAICVYEKVGSDLRLASKMPNGEFAFGQFAAISRDGSRIYWTDFEGHAYVRIDGSSTIRLDQSERTAPPVGGASAASVAGIEAGGERALFVTSEELVDADEDSANDLYAWDGTEPEGERLTLVSQGDIPGVEAEFGQVLGSGGDRIADQSSSRGYFTANNQIVSGESVAPGQKIYFWEAAGGQPRTSYVTTLGNTSLIDGGGYNANVHTSSNGRYLAFVSSERLTAYDNAGKAMIYRYDGASQQLSCVSCDPEGNPPTLPAAFNVVNPAEATFPNPHLLRNVSDKGQVFFESAASLVPRDSNGRRDVYEYQGGLHLISKGTGKDESRFLDASVSGDDVFFVTGDQLVGWDSDHDFDAYDARVNGGLPEPPPGIVGCEGDACQPPPTPPNDPTPASSTFSGAGNVVHKPARKPSKKRSHKKKKRHSAKQHHGSPSTRKHG